MDKIPVFRTIGRAYAFAFGRFFGNLGVVWIPALLLLAASGVLFSSMVGNWGTAFAHMGKDPADAAEAMRDMMQAYRMIILFWLVAILLRAQIMLGLTRRALGRSEGPSFVFLSLGWDYWRLAGAYLAVMIILYAVEIVLIIVLAIVGILTGVTAGLAVHAAGTPHAALGPAAGLGVFALLAAFGAVLFYIAVRLTFLLTPMIVAEHRFDLVGPWQKAGGNFWRIFVIGAAVFVPVFVLIAAIELPVLYFAVLPILHQHMPQVTSHDPKSAQIVFAALGGALREIAIARWYVVAPLALVSSTLVYGMAAGAAAAAWQALNPASESGVEPTA